MKYMIPKAMPMVRFRNFNSEYKFKSNCCLNNFHCCIPSIQLKIWLRLVRLVKKGITLLSWNERSLVKKRNKV